MNLEKTLFNDIIYIVHLTKKELINQPTLESMVNLYNNYQKIIPTIDDAQQFFSGYFTIPISEDIFQNTENFYTPRDKWIYFSKRDLTRLNDSFMKFIKSFAWIKFEDCECEYIFIQNYLQNLDRFLTSKEPEKILFNEDCSEVVYHFINFQNGSTEKLSFEAKILVDEIEKLVSLLEDYKKFLEEYFMKYLDPKNLFLETQRFKFQKLTFEPIG